MTVVEESNMSDIRLLAGVTEAVNWLVRREGSKRRFLEISLLKFTQ
jgi:hypothetical protein